MRTITQEAQAEAQVRAQEEDTIHRIRGVQTTPAEMVATQVAQTLRGVKARQMAMDLPMEVANPRLEAAVNPRMEVVAPLPEAHPEVATHQVAEAKAPQEAKALQAEAPHRMEEEARLMEATQVAMTTQ